jgi:hypothetical protein
MHEEGANHFHNLIPSFSCHRVHVEGEAISSPAPSVKTFSKAFPISNLSPLRLIAAKYKVRQPLR